jgi:hypothetical protein
MCSLHFENNVLAIEGVRFTSIKKTPLSKLSFAFVSISLPLLISGVVDTGDKFIISVVDTAEQLSPVTMTPAINSSPVSMTPVNNDRQ